MTRYTFKVRNNTITLSITRSEGILYYWICESPSWENPLLGDYGKGVVCQRDRKELIAKTEKLIAKLEPQASEIRFVYSLEKNPIGGRLKYNGQFVDVECGPGYAFVFMTEFVRLPNSGASASVTKNLVDLRDLRPVIFDDGREVKATKRLGRHDLLSKVYQLKAFLESIDDVIVECTAC